MTDSSRDTLASPPATPRVAIVTVSYGSQDVLVPFLASLPEATSHPIQLVVADNKPDSTVVPALTLAAGGSYLPLEGNLGYGHAVNAAVRTLPPEVEWIVVSNPDIVISASAIDLLLSSANEDPSIAAIGPRILSSGGDVYPSARSVPSLRSGVGHALLANLWPENPWSRHYQRSTDSLVERRDAGWLSGAFLAIRRSVLDDLEGFDESYFMYFEDVDLGFRIGKLGLRNVYEPAAEVVHSGAHSTKSDTVRMIRAHHTSAMRFLSKKYPGPLLWPLRMVLRIGLALRARLQSNQGER